jgi:DNA-binding MarR family transcriptional regulator
VTERHLPLCSFTSWPVNVRLQKSEWLVEHGAPAMALLVPFSVTWEFPRSARSGPATQKTTAYQRGFAGRAGSRRGRRLGDLESIGIDDAIGRRNPGRVSDDQRRAERFAERFRAVYLTFHRRDGPRSQLQGASRAVLEHLAMAGPLTIGEAAAHLNRAQSVISEIVSHLEEQGLLERESDPADRRRTLIWLTPTGHSALRQDREVLGLDLLARALARVPSRQADELVAGLEALVQAAGPLDQRPQPPGIDPTRPAAAHDYPPGSEGDSDDDDHPGL